MNLKNILFEDDPKPTAKQPVQPVTPWPPHDTGPIVSSSPMPADHSPIYQRLLAQTDFAGTKVGTTLNKYLAPLMSLQIDDHAKYKAALAQAQAQENLTVDAVLGVFELLKDTLKNEKTTFDNSVMAQKSEVIEKQKHLTDLQVQCDRLIGEIRTMQDKLDHALTDFQYAVATRSKELDDQKSQYSALLK